MTLIGNNFAFVGAGLGVLAKNHASSKTRVCRGHQFCAYS